MAGKDHEASYEIRGQETNGSALAANHEAEAGIPLSQVEVAKITKVSSVFTVLVAGLALFSDGYNAQIIG
jgi:hypothetical protein